MSFVSILPTYPSSEEIVTRKFYGGVLLYEFSKFKEKDCPKDLVDKLLSCSDCPGIDGYLPELYTNRIEVKFEDKVYKMPKHLIQDLYNPHVGKAFPDALKVTRDNKRIIINMSGGDGTASYKAKLTINLENKTVRRELYQHPNIDKAQVREGKIK